MYRKLLGAAILGILSFSVLALNLAFAKSDDSSGAPQDEYKAEEKFGWFTNIFRKQKIGLGINKNSVATASKVVFFLSFLVCMFKYYFFHKNEGIELNSEKINVKDDIVTQKKLELKEENGAITNNKVIGLEKKRRKARDKR